MYSHFSNSLLPVGLCLVIALNELSPVAFAQNVPTGINILVVEGEGVTSGIRQQVTRHPVVKVEDDNHRPIAGAAVVFVLPVSGPSGEFPNGSKTLTVVTDKDGLATASGLRTNQVPGELQIYVSASYQGLRARTLVTQMVEAPPGTRTIPELGASKSGGKWKWIVLGLAAAGGAGAAAYYARSSSSSAPISISTGAVVFGSPR
jgi:hypothetical protein